MAQVFHRNANILVRTSLISAGIASFALVSIAAALYRSPAVTMVGVRKDQPVPFSHQRHIGGNDIDCRYCHTSVEHSRFAGIPATETCMTCHSQILSDAPMLEPVHESWKSGKPLEWTRIYDLPDFAYFDHSIHIAKGVGCTTCHGDIQEQRLTLKANTLHMAWCLQCHKAPEKYLRPLDKVFDVAWTPPADQLDQGRALLEKHDVRVGQLMDCSVCHR